jgi:hypothetical protein
MGRGTSKGGGAGAGGGMLQQGQEFPEAFAPGKDFEAVGGVDHDMRTVSRMTQQEWDQYVAQFGSDIPYSEEQKLMKDWDGSNVYGYIRTTNSMALNKQFYDNDGKTPDQIFNKRTKQGRKDMETVDALDSAINTHQTPADGMYYRFCTAKSLQRSYGLSDAQAQQVMQAASMSPAQLAQLNKALSGSKASSPGYTSVSANRSLNAFKNPTKSQSKGYTIERRISVRKGTNAFAAKRNAQESEVIFGRNFGVNFSHITVEGNHIVVHEYH